MEKYFITLELAIKLKEIGFDEPCLCFYNRHKNLVRYMNEDGDWNEIDSQTIKNSDILMPDTYAAPHLEQVFDWFEEKDLYGEVSFYVANLIGDAVHAYRYTIKNIVNYTDVVVETKDLFPSKLNAQIACLENLINIVNPLSTIK